jgi:hypothetical protein
VKDGAETDPLAVGGLFSALVPQTAVTPIVGIDRV